MTAMSAVAPVRPTVEDRIRAALWFAARGFAVFSVWSTDPDGTCRCKDRGKCEQPGKHPVPGIGFKAATTDPGRIRAMLDTRMEPNWGMLPPEGVFILDVDGDGVARLEELEEQYGPLPATLRTNTAHGQHVFLRWPADMPRPIGQMFGYVTRWGTGATTGYVIGPRSVHATGAVYAPVEPLCEIAELPEAWAQATIAPAHEDVIVIGRGAYELPEPGYSGGRYNEILRYVGSRYMRGDSEEEVWAGVLMVLAPRFADGLSEPELRSRFERAWKTTPGKFGPPRTPAEPLVVAPDATAEPVASLDWPAPPADIVYRGAVGEIVRLVADRTEADPVGILGSVLAAAGVCMGRYRTIYQGSDQGANLFVVLVGDSSSGRKGTAGSIARDIMAGAWPDWEQLVVAGLGSGEGLISHLKKVEDSEYRALVMESELGRLLTVMARDGSTLSPVVRDAWDGVPMGRFLARESALVRWHHVGVIAHITPVELREKLTNTDAANGFGNRFLWLAVRRTRLVPFPESPKNLIPSDLSNSISRAIEAAQVPGEVALSPTARDHWEALYAELAMRPRVGLRGAMVARIEAQIIRLALVYALLDRSEFIEVAHLEAARALWDYSERSVTHVFGESTGNRNADELRSRLADGPLEWEEARKALGVRSGADLSDAVELLASLGLAEVVKAERRGGGRRGRVIRTPARNPANPANRARARAHETAETEG